MSIKTINETNSNPSLSNKALKAFPCLTIKVKALEHFKGKLPEYKTEGASGFDIRACLKEDFHLGPGERGLISTGLSFEVPPGLNCNAVLEADWL